MIRRRYPEKSISIMVRRRRRTSRRIIRAFGVIRSRPRTQIPRVRRGRLVKIVFLGPRSGRKRFRPTIFVPVPRWKWRVGRRTAPSRRVPFRLTRSMRQFNGRRKRSLSSRLKPVSTRFFPFGLMVIRMSGRTIMLILILLILITLTYPGVLFP